VNLSRDASEPLPDAAPVGHLFRLLPPVARPFAQLARLDRPIGWQLLLLPCWQSSALAAAALHEAPDLRQLVLFFLGAVSMRGAGSTFNDYIDRDIDAKVERTRARPLPSGRVTSRAALLFFVAQSLVGLAVLLSFNWLTVGVALISPLIYLAYPFAKRLTSWPQAVLGLAFAYGALVGWTARADSLAPPAFLLYGAAICWTIGYDTVYALQDIRDDARAGVRSTARLFGARVRPAVGALYAAATTCAALAVFEAGGGIYAYAGVLGFAAHLAWQTRQIKVDLAAQEALGLFRANRDAGLLLFAGFLAQSLASLHS